MQNISTRIVAALLIPCLMADPLTLHALETSRHGGLSARRADIDLLRIQAILPKEVYAFEGSTAHLPVLQRLASLVRAVALVPPLDALAGLISRRTKDGDHVELEIEWQLPGQPPYARLTWNRNPVLRQSMDLLPLHWSAILDLLPEKERRTRNTWMRIVFENPSTPDQIKERLEAEIQRHAWIGMLQDALEAAYQTMVTRGATIDLRNTVGLARRIDPTFDVEIPLIRLVNGWVEEVAQLELALRWKIFFRAGEWVEVEIRDKKVTMPRWIVDRSVPFVAHDYLGSVVWSGQAERLNGAPKSGVAIGPYGFSNPKKIAKYGAQEYHSYEKGVPGNVVEARLRSLLKQAALDGMLDESEFIKSICTPFVDYEELRHAKAFRYAEQRPGNAGLEHRLHQGTTIVDEIVRKTENGEPASSILASYWHGDLSGPKRPNIAMIELEGKTGAAIDQIELDFVAGRYDIAYITFLRYLSMMYVLMLEGIIEEQKDGPTSKTREKILTSTMFFMSLYDQFGIEPGKDIDALWKEILDHVKDGQGSRVSASHGLKLLKALYDIYFWTQEERAERLGLPSAVAAPKPKSESAVSEEGRRLALPFKGVNPVAMWEYTEEQQRAMEALFNYPADDLLNDFRTLPLGSDAYQLTVAALCLNGSLETYRSAHALYPVLSDDPQKQHDLVNILRNIQTFASMTSLPQGETKFKFINRKTFDARAANSIPAIDLAVDAYRGPDPFVIGDVAVSDGTSALELARHYEGRNVQVIGYDRTFSVYRHYLDAQTVMYFDSEGKIIQQIHQNKVVLRAQMNSKAVRAIENAWEESPEFEPAMMKTISLLNPEAETYARQYPNRLRFKTQDAFKPINRRHHFIRVLGFLVRGEYSYFNDETIKRALGVLARSLEDGGFLMNGSFWEEGEGEFDLFQRDGAHLLHREFHKYLIEDHTMRHTQSLDEKSTSDWDSIPIANGITLFSFIAAFGSALGSAVHGFQALAAHHGLLNQAGRHIDLFFKTMPIDFPSGVFVIASVVLAGAVILGVLVPPSPEPEDTDFAHIRSEINQAFQVVGPQRANAIMRLAQVGSPSEVTLVVQRLVHELSSGPVEKQLNSKKMLEDLLEGQIATPVIEMMADKIIALLSVRDKHVQRLAASLIAQMARHHVAVLRLPDAIEPLVRFLAGADVMVEAGLETLSELIDQRVGEHLFALIWPAMIHLAQYAAHPIERTRALDLLSSLCRSRGMEETALSAAISPALDNMRYGDIDNIHDMGVRLAAEDLMSELIERGIDRSRWHLAKKPAIQNLIEGQSNPTMDEIFLSRRNLRASSLGLLTELLAHSSEDLQEEVKSSLARSIAADLMEAGVLASQLDDYLRFAEVHEDEAPPPELAGAAYILEDFGPAFMLPGWLEWFDEICRAARGLLPSETEMYKGVFSGLRGNTPIEASFMGPIVLKIGQSLFTAKVRADHLHISWYSKQGETRYEVALPPVGLNQNITLQGDDTQDGKKPVVRIGDGFRIADSTLAKDQINLRVMRQDLRFSFQLHYKGSQNLEIEFLRVLEDDDNGETADVPFKPNPGKVLTFNPAIRTLRRFEAITARRLQEERESGENIPKKAARDEMMVVFDPAEQTILELPIGMVRAGLRFGIIRVIEDSSGGRRWEFRPGIQSESTPPGYPDISQLEAQSPRRMKPSAENKRPWQVPWKHRTRRTRRQGGHTPFTFLAGFIGMLWIGRHLLSLSHAIPGVTMQDLSLLPIIMLAGIFHFGSRQANFHSITPQYNQDPLRAA